MQAKKCEKFYLKGYFIYMIWTYHSILIVSSSIIVRIKFDWWDSSTFGEFTIIDKRKLLNNVIEMFGISSSWVESHPYKRTWRLHCFAFSGPSFYLPVYQQDSIDCYLSHGNILSISWNSRSQISRVIADFDCNICFLGPVRSTYFLD